ncbi:hypothetical protein [Mailhella sp.]
MSSPKSSLQPLRFHCTFKPERNHIRSLMAFIASGRKGTPQEISEATNIPMGKSTGKVTPTIGYCLAMGLIKVYQEKQAAGVKEFTLTPFGKKVFLGDPYLRLPVTQWIAHLFLCHPLSGAKAWMHTFADGFPMPLGWQFTPDQLQTHLESFFDGKNLTGPMVGMYNDSASFELCGALKETGKTIERVSPPINEETIAGYGAWLLQLLDDFFPDTPQVPLSTFQDTTKWTNVTAWTTNEQVMLFTQWESRGLISIDRHMTPWLIIRRCTAEQAWQHIYDDIL